MLSSGSMPVLPAKAKLEGCVNFSNNTPQLGESPQSSGEVISSPRSPDYPPRVSVSPHNSDTTFSMSMMSAIENSTVIMDTVKYEKKAKMFIDKILEYPFCVPPKKVENPEIGTTQAESTNGKQQDDTTRETSITDGEAKAEPVDIKTEPVKLQENSQVVKSEWIESDTSAVTSCRPDTTTSQEKFADPTVASSSISHSKTCSSRKKRSKEHDSERRHCSRCHRRKSIKRASIGVQCKRDRHVLSSLGGKPMPASYSKSTNENLRLNLQTKSCKMLNNPMTKSELLEGLKYKKFIHIETYPNGGATVVHMYQDEIDHLLREQMEELAQEYFKVICFIAYCNKINSIFLTGQN